MIAIRPRTSMDVSLMVKVSSCPLVLLAGTCEDHGASMYRYGGGILLLGTRSSLTQLQLVKMLMKAPTPAPAQYPSVIFVNYLLNYRYLFEFEIFHFTYT